MYSSAAGEAVPGVSLYSTCIAVRRVKLCQSQPIQHMYSSAAGEAVPESAYTAHV